MYGFVFDGLGDEIHQPIDHVLFDEDGDYVLLYRALLQQCQAESLDN
jgi:hypothetical protein